MSEDDVGSVAEEAAKLLAALQGWAREAGGSRAAQGEAAASAMADRLKEVNDHLGHGPDCRYCPICQTISFFRETSPEAREKITTAAISAMTSMAEALAALFPPPEPGTDGTSGVERIDLTDDEWDQP
jgi:bacterioferritin-associated ferredoxin